jgi:site-specific recombinase XerD
MSLEPTHRPSTANGYRTSLRGFHQWLEDGRIRLTSVSRPQIEQWLLSLYDQGLHPSTRVHMIQHVRAYVRWLQERGQVRHDADELIRGSDMPRLPTYLPRPLSPEIDRALQERLARSLHPPTLGLLVMRLTGMRVGELRSLEYDCIRTDADGNSFLKVPLGKLHSERLVPMPPQAIAIVRWVQQIGIRPRPYLIAATDGSILPYPKFTRALRDASEGLETSEPITSHRLRHTYATSLLDAGMSLLGIMRLLGHRDFRMTLRYTAITQETVGKEYLEALDQLESRYAALASHNSAPIVDPIAALDDVLAWTKNQLAHDLGQPQLAQKIVKSLSRVRETIERSADGDKPRNK